MNKPQLRIVGLVAAVSAAMSVLCFALRACGADSPGAEFWLVSTREQCGGPSPFAAQLPYWRLGSDGQWVQADQAAFLAGAKPDTPNVFYFHGNDSSVCDAIAEGWGIYCKLKEQAPGRPFRLVVWSWPAERIARRIRQDLQIKAARSDFEACYLAAALEPIRPDVPVSLIGYSFARESLEALWNCSRGEISLVKGFPSIRPRVNRSESSLLPRASIPGPSRQEAPTTWAWG